MSNPALSTANANVKQQGQVEQDLVGRSTSRDKCNAHEQKLVQALREAHLSGKPKLARYRQRRYLESYATRYMATEAAFKSLRVGLRPPKSSLSEIAEGLNAWRGTGEKVEVRWEPKKNNDHDFRTIMNFGIEHRALQYMVSSCLKAQANLHPMQFAIHCGRQAAVQRAYDLMLSGYEYVTEMDIANCYPSFNGEKLAGLLPLPKEVTEKIILSNHFSLHPANMCCQSWGTTEEMLDLFSEDLTEARRGIAQGSAASNVVAEILLSSVLAQLPECGVALSYADNILLLTKSNQEAVSMRKALGSVLHAHPAGPLALKEPKIYEPGQAVDFLGYSITVGKSGAVIEPSKENLWKFKSEFEAKLKKVSAKSISLVTYDKQVNELKTYVKSWSNAFALWPLAKQHRQQYMAMIEKKVG